MSFDTPAVLWGLFSLLLLVIFSLWRQAATRTTVPSLRLWRAIPERNPPIRALRRPRWRLELLLQALALACAVTALAGPFTLSDLAVPRKVAFVFDTSPRMAAEGRLEKAKARAREMAAKLPPTDELVVYWREAGPRRGGSIDAVTGAGAHVDVDVLLDAAREEAGQVVLFSDRAPEGVPAELFGASGTNVGIVACSVTDTEVFARIVNHGPERTVEATLTVDGEKRPLGGILLPRGETSWSRKVPLSGAKRVRLDLATGDHLAVDDRAEAVRLADPSGTVALVGDESPFLLRALESIPGIRVRHGAGRAMVSVILEKEGAGFVPGTFTLADHPLTAHLRAREVTSGLARVLKAPAGAEPLFYADGKLVGAVWEGAVHLSFELSPGGWAGTPSFPIFWKNVVDRARGAAAAFSTEAEGVLNLLDERESDTAGVTRASGWDPGDPASRELQKSSLVWPLSVAAIVLLLVAWFLQSRGD